MRKLRLAALLLAASIGSAAHAQQYPVRSIRFISPFPPGGGNDTLSRIVGDKLGEQIGQRIIVDNRPGANTIVGTELLAKSPPDGYTLALLPNTFATNPSFYPKLPYDTLKDFAAVGQVAQSPQMLLVHPSLPAKTLKELARAREIEARTTELWDHGQRLRRPPRDAIAEHDDRRAIRARARTRGRPLQCMT